MNLAPFYPWIVFFHVLAGFSFVLSHGVSMFMSDRVRREREPDRIRAMLDISKATQPVMYGSLVILLIAGITAGLVGGHFGRGWIWAALAILIAEIAAMYALATRYYAQVRTAAGLASGFGPRAEEVPAAATPQELDRLLSSRRPDVIAVVGSIGLIVIIWLMVVKPF
jgi:hypothetical protein